MPVKKKLCDVSRKLQRMKKRLETAQSSIAQMKADNERISDEAYEEGIRMLPPKQQLAVRACFQAARRRSTNGMVYDDEWVLECLLMRMRSPKLYEHLRTQKILILPSRSRLQRYFCNFRGGFGFSPKLFSALQKKTEGMEKFSCRGGILVDEMKLSEHLDVRQSGDIQGFVDLGEFTTTSHNHDLCNHGMVILFQPFTGSWTQILGVFAAKGNVKADVLSKIILEATILAEKSGLYVDYITSDAASWNRSMWRMFGIQGTAEVVRCKVQHPVDEQRYLYFVSDFPHLVKNIRNIFLAKGFSLPGGSYVHRKFIEEAWKKDSEAVTLKAMLHITTAHTRPNSFDKMKVNLAFQLFSDEVLKGLFVYCSHIESCYGSPKATEGFIRLMSRLIKVMTSRTPSQGLRPNSSNAEFIKEFLAYLNEWEQHTKNGNGGFLSSSTAAGLRVTLHSALGLLEYLCSPTQFKYLLTCRLSQDKLENLFGIIRQSSGTNDHPTAAQFLVTVNLLSFYNLAKPPKSGNSSPNVVSALLPAGSLGTDKQRTLLHAFDDLMDTGRLDDAERVLKSSIVADAGYEYTEKYSNSLLIYYTAGYVARKTIKRNKCPQCAESLCVSQQQGSADANSALTATFDHGGLLYPSSVLSQAVNILEDSFTVFFSARTLHARSMMDFTSFLSTVSMPKPGCDVHTKEVTLGIVKFYVLLRFRFFVKSLNKESDIQRERQKLLKLRRCK